MTLPECGVSQKTSHMGWLGLPTNLSHIIFAGMTNTTCGFVSVFPRKRKITWGFKPLPDVESGRRVFRYFFTQFETH